MATLFSSIKERVQELIDGRSFAESKHSRWANDLRKEIAMDFDIAGFRGLYFLYKEATVKDGSIAQQSKYLIPDDFIDDLNVFYDGGLLLKAPPGILDITQETEATEDSTASPKWVRLMGVEFQIWPPPPDSGKVIKLLYNALPSEIPASDNSSFTDYFLAHFPSLHVYGIAEMAALSVGQTQYATLYNQKLAIEKRKLQTHNRRHFFKNIGARFSNWEEYQEKKRFVYPQFQEI